MMTRITVDQHQTVQADTWKRARLIEALCQVRHDVDFAALSERFRELAPHRYFAYAVLHITEGRIEQLYNHDFPAQRLNSLHLAKNCECRPLKKWLAKREPMPVISAREDPPEDASQGLPDPIPLVMHAQLSLVGPRAIAFCLGDVPVNGFERARHALKILAPSLYAAAVRAMHSATQLKALDKATERLTPREREVLSWVYHGKTDDEIASILGISVFTVKSHLQRVLLKLNAMNRVQAILRACEAGVVQDAVVPTNLPAGAVNPLHRHM